MLLTYCMKNKEQFTIHMYSSAACARCRSFFGIAGSNPNGHMQSLSPVDFVCCTDRGLCDGPIPCQERSHRVRMCH